MTNFTRVDRLEMAIDEHLILLRDEMTDFEDSDWTPQLAAAFLRAAWAKGALDSLRDPARARAVFESLGYRV